MVTYDFMYRCQSEAAPGRTCCEERLEDPSQSELVHATAVIPHRYAQISARLKLAMGEQAPADDFVHLCLDLDASGIFHRLRCIVAEIEDHLLQLGRLARHDGSHRRFVDHEIDPGRQAHIQQRRRLGNYSPGTQRPATRVAVASECKNLIDEGARPLCSAADRIEIAKRPGVRTEM